MCTSNVRATVRLGPDSQPAATPVPGEGEGDGTAPPHRRTVWTMLRDYRMLAHDDGEGRPLRYMSLYGGIVTKML